MSSLQVHFCETQLKMATQKSLGLGDILGKVVTSPLKAFTGDAVAEPTFTERDMARGAVSGLVIGMGVEYMFQPVGKAVGFAKSAF